MLPKTLSMNLPSSWLRLAVHVDGYEIERRENVFDFRTLVNESAVTLGELVDAVAVMPLPQDRKYWNSEG
jgi:hypothetical protein